jgi:hypothetical protein
VVLGWGPMRWLESATTPTRLPACAQPRAYSILGARGPSSARSAPSRIPQGLSCSTRVRKMRSLGEASSKVLCPPPLRRPNPVVPPSSRSASPTHPVKPASHPGPRRQPSRTVSPRHPDSVTQAPGLERHLRSRSHLSNPLNRVPTTFRLSRTLLNGSKRDSRVSGTLSTGSQRLSASPGPC